MRFLNRAFTIGLVVSAFVGTMAGGVFAAEAMLEIRPAGYTEFLAEDLIEKIADVPNITRAEKYLIVAAEPHDVIGIEAGAFMWVVGEGKITAGKVQRGRAFRADDVGKRVAVVGKVVFMEDYRPSTGGMTGMRHRFDIGSTFALRGVDVRLRVIGEYSVGSETWDEKVFLPLDVAQEIYGKKGKISRILLTVDSEDNLERAAGRLRTVFGRENVLISRLEMSKPPEGTTTEGSGMGH
jgi:hypothetical protein